MFYCFGCGEGGNVFSFVMKYENMTFQESLKMLADRAGVALPEIHMSDSEKKAAGIKESICNANADAARYYHKMLGTERGRLAMEYIDKRKLLPETVTAFGLGVSSQRKDELYNYLKDKGYSDDILKRSGLVKFDEAGPHDTFRNRLMFPILNINRKVIGFGGRVMSTEKKIDVKYLNTSETEVFDKGRNLYGMYIARSSRKNNIIICEGYMDVIAMHQAGFNQAVASLGTALTQGQALLIKRYTKDVLVCYDSDGAGTKAALRAIGIFRAAGLRCKVINMEPHKDADEFIKALGAEAFQERIDNAENAFLFEVRMLQKNYDINDPEAKTAFFNEVAGKLVEFEEELERENYIEAVANKYFISRDALRKLVAKHAAGGYGIRDDATPPKAGKKEPKDDGILKAQRMLLTWICDDRKVYDAVSRYISPEDFSTEAYRKAAGLIFEKIRSGSFNAASLLNGIEDDEEQKIIAGIVNTEILDEDARREDREKALNEAVIIIKKNSIDEKSRNVTDISQMQELIKEQALLKTIQVKLL